MIKSSLLCVCVILFGLTVCGYTQNATNQITLQDTISLVIQKDPLSQKNRIEKDISAQRIHELRLGDTWSLEILGNLEADNGNRRETRNTSRGRSFQDNYGDLSEQDNWIGIGLKRTFLEPSRKTRSDIAEENVREIERQAEMASEIQTLALETALLYLNLYYHQGQKQIIDEQIKAELETLRILKIRENEGETTPLEVMESESKLQALRKKKIQQELSIERKLDVIRAIWSDPGLSIDRLSEPIIEEASSLIKADSETLVAFAMKNHPQILSARVALRTHLQRSGMSSILPELDVELIGRYREGNRTFYDEGRDTETIDMIAKMELSVPLTIKEQNESRKRRYELTTRSRQTDIQTLENKVTKSVKRACEELLLAVEETRFQQMELRRLAEKERVALLKYETDPEILGEQPELVAWDARIDYLQAQSACMAAMEYRQECLLVLMDAMGLPLNQPMPQELFIDLSGTHFQ